jgi:anti-anti-sigma factor
MIDLERSPQPPPNPAQTPTLTVTLSRPQSHTTVCTVTGTVDWNTRPLLRNALTQARHDDNAHLVIDLSAVTAMNCAGPYTLLEARAHHHGGGHLAVVTNPHSSAIPELHTVAIRAAFDVHPTLISALHSCTPATTPTHDKNHPNPTPNTSFSNSDQPPSISHH